MKIADISVKNDLIVISDEIYEKLIYDGEHISIASFSDDIKERTILTRQFSAKHYWFPLKVSDTSIYPEFGQNPGW